MSWTAPQDFFAGTPQSVVDRWLDYWIICDDTHAYMFFPDDHGRMYRSCTTLADFPSGFDEPAALIHEAKNDLFEGSCVYQIKGTNQFLLVECIGKHRYYRAWVSDHRDGPPFFEPHEKNQPDPIFHHSHETPPSHCPPVVVPDHGGAGLFSWPTQATHGGVD
jgi:hypothetical protein